MGILDFVIIGVVVGGIGFLIFLVAGKDKK